MSKYIDTKVTIWGRIHLKDDADMNKLIEMLKKNNSINSICDESLGFSEYEILYDTEEEITPEENNGDPTIEVFDDAICSVEPLWTNQINKQ